MIKVNNKKIGIIGGVGPQATCVLYSEITKYAQIKYRAKNNDDYPSIVIESVPIPDFISDKGQMDEAFIMLGKVVRNLESVGCTRLCIASNTVHLLIEDLERMTKVRFLSIISLVAKKVNDLKIKKVGLVGSSVLLGSGLYEKEFKKRGIELILPDEDERRIIEKLIRNVLAGKDNGRERNIYIKILHNLIDKGVKGIILGCTELPLAINYEALGERIINSKKVLAEGIADYYYT
jgi:aspartate racemase